MNINVNQLFTCDISWKVEIYNLVDTVPSQHTKTPPPYASIPVSTIMAPPHSYTPISHMPPPRRGAVGGASGWWAVESIQRVSTQSTRQVSRWRTTPRNPVEKAPLRPGNGPLEPKHEIARKYYADIMRELCGIIKARVWKRKFISWAAAGAPDRAHFWARSFPATIHLCKL